MKLVYICSLINSSFASDYTGDQTLNLNQSREELNDIVTIINKDDQKKADTTQATAGFQKEDIYNYMIE